ncbi:hypothetical protein R5R35_002460 [Gryllus longicercus]|uniref:Strictosidine synthase conserved region domain-containing protein n=1 Tax=Gryllus longicercus TaxID=2509291 RepID=A0AAN9VFM1_9ORTH|nr:Uncharacterized protein GBIM_04112 [Gryllus bimaculatus]
MDLVKSLGIRTIEAVIVFFLVTFLPGFPPNMEFTAFSVAPSMPLKGTLELNTKLNNAERLLDGDIKGPEHIVAYNGELYTGIHGGEIVKIVNGKFVPVVKFGRPCAGLWEESVCGRPLGFQFDKNGNIYVADAYYGIFKYEMRTGTSTTLVSINETIDGKTPKLPNDVAVASDGTVYWTDSSTEITLEDGVYACLGDGSGRLLRYDPKTHTNEVLMYNMHFPNGLALSPKEDYLLMSETVRSRIHKYYLKGPKAGTSEIFIDGLPGLPDNLKSLGEEGFLVPLVMARDSENILIFQLMGPYPLLRKFFARILAAIEVPLQYAHKFFPHYYLQRAIHWLGHFESVSAMSPKRTTILHLDLDGNVVESFHGNDSTVSGISSVEIFEDAFYLGSPYNTYIGRVKLPLTLKKTPVKSVKE